VNGIKEASFDNSSLNERMKKQIPSSVVSDIVTVKSPLFRRRRRRRALDDLITSLLAGMNERNFQFASASF